MLFLLLSINDSCPDEMEAEAMLAISGKILEE
jgi:hypothetical protein